MRLMLPSIATKQRCVLQETMKYFIRDKHTRQKAAAARVRSLYSNKLSFSLNEHIAVFMCD